MNRFDFRIYYHIIRIIKTIRRLYYGGERISEDDLNIVHYKAEQAKLTLTEYVTQRILGKQIFVIDGLDEVIRQQKAIGKNINRLTVLSNMGKISSVNLQELTEEYAALNKTLTELLDRKRWSA